MSRDSALELKVGSFVLVALLILSFFVVSVSNFSFFEKGMEEHEGMMVFLKHWSKLVPWLDEDSRVQALYRKIGLA